MKKKIKFEKWIDPLNSNIDEVEWPGYNENEDGEITPIYSTNINRVMHTPFGMLTVLNSTMAVNAFDFWLMHTNFDITNEIRDIIKVVPGVESLEIYTRYRARIGFPKSGFFQSSDIMNTIQRAILIADYNKQNQLLVGLPIQVANDVIDMRSNIDAKHENWAILILPNGHIETLTADKIDNLYRLQLEIFNATKILVGGRLLTSGI